MNFPKTTKKKKAAVDFHNVVSTCNYGHSHRSKLESSVCQMIYLRERAGEIRLLQVEATVYLTLARYKYIPDFRCVDVKTNEVFFIEAKGYPDKRWPTTKKLWKFYGPGRLEIWSGSHIRPTLDEEIIPIMSICSAEVSE